VEKRRRSGCGWGAMAWPKAWPHAPGLEEGDGAGQPLMQATQPMSEWDGSASGDAAMGEEEGTEAVQPVSGWGGRSEPMMPDTQPVAFQACDPNTRHGTPRGAPHGAAEPTPLRDTSSQVCVPHTHT
jgi:hypothetical protein